MERAASWGFKGAVKVTRGDDVLVDGAWGKAGDRDATTNTAFDVGSITKSVTAGAALRLQDLGLLHIDDPIDAYLVVPPDKHAITIRHLMTHTSGVVRDMGFHPDVGDNREFAVSRMLAPALRFEPGTSWAYSNVGYSLLAAVVEVVSRESYESFVRREIFDRAGMSRSGFVGDPPDLPIAHGDDFGNFIGPADEQTYHWGWRGAAGMITTTGDLHRWHRALAAHEVLTPETTALMHAPYMQDYACGWFVHALDQTYVWHDGSTRGFEASLHRHPSFCIAVVSNTRRVAPRVGAVLANGMLNREWALPPALGDEPLDVSAMVCELPEEATLRCRVEGEVLVASPLGQRAVDMIAGQPPSEYNPIGIMNEELADLVRGASEGDPYAVLGLAAEWIPEDWGERWLREVWSPVVEELGAYVDVEIVGTVTGRPMESRVLVRFEDGERTLLAQWEGQKIRRLEFESEPGLDLRFRRGADGSLVTFDLMSWKTIELDVRDRWVVYRDSRGSHRMRRRSE